MLVGVAAIVLGVGCNSWIVYINLMDWGRGLHLSLPDQILSFMALINAVLEHLLCFDVISLATSFFDSADPIHLKILDFLIFLISCNIWLTGWLSVYYYMRIVRFSGGLLLKIKIKISKLLPKLMVVSTIESLIIALPSFWNIYIKRETIGNATLHSSEENTLLIISPPYLITAYLGCGLPLMLTLIPIGLTISSLWKHMKRMNTKNVISSRPQTQAHITAVKTMVLLVTAHTGFHAFSIFILMRSFNFIDILMMFSGYFVVLYPAIQALIMITGNSKLKQAGKGLLRWGFPCAMQGKKERKAISSPNTVRNIHRFKEKPMPAPDL
ncbi:taste receptor type 2 member 140-like [Phyllobates terribilis]|uniref:taste receptor type 2 member 140-like n=1 Tax=Phyllobates terribilis TaxID=111132 RepID=UPI003CCAEB90